MAQNNLIYYKCMLPNFLKTRVFGVATVGSTDTELVINQDTADFEKILQLPIFGPGILPANLDITVCINVSAEGPPPKRYDPLAICISDNAKVMGVQLRDPSEYVSIAPYQGIFGNKGHILTSVHELKSNEKEENFRRGDWQRWPQMFQIKLKPNPPRAQPADPQNMPPWGLCSSAANGGISLSYIYPAPLQINDGIDLELYRNKSTETYTINMIEVSVYQDS